MTLVRDILTGALQKIGVQPVGDAAAAEEAAFALTAYNGILHGFVADGWLASHTTATAETAVALGVAYHEGLKALVAERVASAFSLDVPLRVRMEARQVLDRLAAAAFAAEGSGAKFEDGLWRPRPAEPFYKPV